MHQITISEIPEPLRQLFTQIQSTKTPLTITDHGQPLVVVYPATPHRPRPGFGVMKDRGEILGDLVAPAAPTVDTHFTNSTWLSTVS